MSRMTVKDETVVMISTSFDDAITKNAMTNDAVAFRFFLGYFLRNNDRPGELSLSDYLKAPAYPKEKDTCRKFARGFGPVPRNPTIR